MNALLVSEDAHLVRQISAKLGQLGHQVSCVSGSSITRTLLQQDVDLVLCDLGQDTTPSLALLSRLGHVLLPKIAIGSAADPYLVVDALRRGADDYMSRPLHMAELAARMEALVRRARVYSRHSVLQDRAVSLDADTCELCIDGRTISLTPTEFSLLQILARRPGEAVARDVLVRHVWGSGARANDRLNLYIWNLRQKIEDDPNHPRWIVTRRGKGYCFRVPSHRET